MTDSDAAPASPSNNFTTLACPACGARLELPANADTQAEIVAICAYCGNKHILRRPAETPTPGPVVVEIRHVQRSVDSAAQEVRQVHSGMDLAARELTIARLRADIQMLERRLETIHRSIGLSLALTLVGAFVFCVLLGGRTSAYIFTTIIFVAFCMGLLTFAASLAHRNRLQAAIVAKQAEIERLLHDTSPILSERPGPEPDPAPFQRFRRRGPGRFQRSHTQRRRF